MNLIQNFSHIPFSNPVTQDGFSGTVNMVVIKDLHGLTRKQSMS